MIILPSADTWKENYSIQDFSDLLRMKINKTNSKEVIFTYQDLSELTLGFGTNHIIENTEGFEFKVVHFKTVLYRIIRSHIAQIINIP